MEPPEMQPLRPPLRDRSKAKRRLAIQRAALELFAEQGYEQTTMAQIADKAEVARRTIGLYFSSKIELAMSAASDRAARLSALFMANAGLSYVEVIAQWLAEAAEAQPTHESTLNTRMFAANPSLRGTRTPEIEESALLARQALAGELGLPAEAPIVHVVAATANAAVAAYAMSPELFHTRREWFTTYLHTIVLAAQPDQIDRAVPPL